MVGKLLRQSAYRWRNMANSMALSTQLANSIMSRFSDPDRIPFKPWCYVQGYILAGFEKIWLTTQNSKYLDYILKFVDQHVSEDGAISDFNGDSMDDMMAGAMVVAAYAHTRKEKYRKASAAIRAAFSHYPRNSDGAFWHARSLPHEFWIDGVFMGGMFLSRYGAVFNDRSSFDEVTDQILTFARRCTKTNTGLFLHAYDESRKVVWADPVTGLSPEVWSEGLGWYALILIETLHLLPVNHPSFQPLTKILIDLVNGLRKYQDPISGLWYQVVDKGECNDNWHDTSGSAMFLYAIQSAIEMGFVPTELFTPVVQHGYQALLTKVVMTPDNMVDVLDACDGVCVQKSYSDYVNYKTCINAKEAVGGVLWASGLIEKAKDINHRH
jgi:rhamnogalacturonyl hydrolase YesR